MSESILSSETHHTKHIDVLRNDSSRLMSQVSSISRRINQLQETTIQSCDISGYIHLQDFQLDEQVSDIQNDLKALCQNKPTYIRALGQSLELFLYLSWPPAAPIDYASLADRLKQMLENPYASPCSSFHLKLWQYFVGAVAADAYSGTREWLMRELRRMLRAIGICKWDEVTPILDRTYFPNPRLLHRFKSVWYELGIS